MSRNTPKYKIIFQTKSNVWGKYNNENKFNKKKWGKFLKYLDFKKTNFFLRKPKSLKVLSFTQLKPTLISSTSTL